MEAIIDDLLRYIFQILFTTETGDEEFDWIAVYQEYNFAKAIKDWKSVRLVNHRWNQFANECDFIDQRFERYMRRALRRGEEDEKAFGFFLQFPKINPHIELESQSGYGEETSLAKISRLGWTDTVEMMLNDPRVETTDDELHFACMEGHIGIVNLLLADPRIRPDGKNGRNHPLAAAVQFGNIEIVRILMKYPQCVPDWWAFNQGCSIENVELVQLLCTKFDPSSNESSGLIEAVRFRAASVVAYLLTFPEINPSTSENCCVVMACANADFEVFQLLYNDPRLEYSNAEINKVVVDMVNRQTIEEGHFQILRILLDDPKIDQSTINKVLENARDDRIIELFRSKQSTSSKEEVEI